MSPAHAPVPDVDLVEVDGSDEEDDMANPFAKKPGMDGSPAKTELDDTLTDGSDEEDDMANPFAKKPGMDGSPAKTELGDDSDIDDDDAFQTHTTVQWLTMQEVRDMIPKNFATDILNDPEMLTVAVNFAMSLAGRQDFHHHASLDVKKSKNEHFRKHKLKYVIPEFNQQTRRYRFIVTSRRKCILAIVPVAWKGIKEMGVPRYAAPA
jgi:hypothetical protein